MLKIYCKYCGSPSGYTLERPKYCQGCAKPFGGVGSSELKSPKKSPRRALAEKVLIEEEEDEDEEIINIPSLDKLDIEISAKGPATHSFKELSEAQVSEYDQAMPLPKDPRSSKEVFEEYQREAGNKTPNRDLAFSKEEKVSKSKPSPKKARGRPRGRPKKEGK